MKRTLLLLLVALLPVAASAYDAKINGIYYILDSWQATVTYRDDSFNSYSGTVEIPASVTFNGKTYTVRRIGERAFRNCTGLTSVTIPNSVTNIDYFAFYNCTSLTSIDIPESVIYIGESAFSSCSSLTSVTIGSGVENIGISAFAYCKGLTSVTIPNSVIHIGNTAFSGCESLASIMIPNSVTKIGNRAFAACRNLTTIVVESGNEKYDSRNNCNAIIETETNTLIIGCKNTAIPYNVTNIGDGVFYDCSGLTSIIIPNSVTNIGNQAFMRCTNLASVTIGNSVTNIGNEAFEGCTNLASVTIGSSVTSIGNMAFERCESLTSVTIPESVTSIGYSAFHDCIRLTSVTIPNSVTNIDGFAFRGCICMTSVTIGSGVENIKEYTFGNCTALASVTVPNSVKWIGDNAFLYCSNLTSVTIGSGVKSISSSAFNNCSNLTSVTINCPIVGWGFKGITSIKEIILGNNVTSIGDYVFQNCSGLASITIPNSVTSIGGGAFSECSGLTSVIIGSSVTNIGSYAFSGCSNLNEVFCCAKDVPTTGTRPFENYRSATLSVPAGSMEVYSKTAPWNDFGIIESLTIDFADANVKAICVANWDTDGDGELSKIEAAAVTSLGSVFKGNTTITSFNELEYFTRLTSIGNYAFSGCSNLKTVTIPENVTSIGDYTFSGCSSLTEVLCYAKDVPTTNNNSFSNSSYETATLLVPASSVEAYSKTVPWSSFGKIKTITIDFADAYIKAICVANWDLDGDGELSKKEAAAVISIGNVFKDNTAITSFNELEYFTGLTNFELYAFSGCSSLKSITIPNCVTSIGNYAFCWCSSLNSIIIPNSVTFIGDFTFERCSNLTSVSIGNGVTNIGKYAFCGCSGLTSITIPNSVTTIGGSAFQNCSNLTSITIPNSVTTIGGSAFAYCSNLTSITIPNSVTSIGEKAFYPCYKLSFVKVEKKIPLEIGYNTFSNCANAILQVPVGSKTAYEAANYWKEFKKIVDHIDNGDVNVDEQVNVVDVVDIARFVVGTPENTFVEILADINQDGSVNIGDAVTLVNDIAGYQNFVKTWNAPGCYTANDLLSLTEHGDCLLLNLDNERSYTAFQFDLYVPEDADVDKMMLDATRRQGHQLLYNKVAEGHYRVAALSTSNNAFNGNDGVLLSIALTGSDNSEVSIRNIHFFDAQGKDYLFEDMESAIATGINNPSHDSDLNGGEIYDLQGRKHEKMQKGVNIISGRKIMVK